MHYIITIYFWILKYHENFGNLTRKKSKKPRFLVPVKETTFTAKTIKTLSILMINNLSLTSILYLFLHDFQSLIY